MRLSSARCVTHERLPNERWFSSGQEHELLDWLAEVTFPMEARFADADFAKRAYTSVIKRTLDYGVRMFAGLGYVSQTDSRK